MRWMLIVAVAVAVLSQQARAQVDIKPDQLKKMYDDAQAQLKAAQDRKNELAMENEKLNAKVADLQKQLEAAKADQATFAQRTFQYQATMNAWQAFLKHYPILAGRWEAYLQADVLAPASLPEWNDADTLTPPATRQHR